MGPSDHDVCEMRYRKVLDRLHEVTERLEQLERDERTIVDLLSDFRELLRVVTTRLKALDHRIEKMLARLIPLREPGERIMRHFRN